MKPRGPLMIEHRLIEKVLRVARSVALGMDEEHYDPVFIDRMVDFIVTYADKTHHGKEEDILFEALEAKALDAQDQADMAKLRDDHRQAREKVRHVTMLNARFRAGDHTVVKEIRDVVLWLADFYPVHIGKEDTRFFVRTERYFTQEELSDMLDRFWEFDRQMIHQKYQAFYKEISGT